MKRLLCCAAGLIVAAGLLPAAEKGAVVHCFTFTPVATASQADWDAFEKATSELKGKVKGLTHVFHGKLARPQMQIGLAMTDAEARKKLIAAGKGAADVSVQRRERGVCMVFENEAAFKAYGPDPAHKAWEEFYGKVRVPGTTTFQIVTH